MNDFNPGDGWREVIPPDPEPEGDLLILYPAHDEKRVWVREGPVPPLPTQPYTVIRVRWKDGLGGGSENFVLSDGWVPTGQGHPILAEALQSNITGFEVLAEPVREYEEIGKAMSRVRRETAKAVVQAFGSAYCGAHPTWVGYAVAENAIRTQFGVEL